MTRSFYKICLAASLSLFISGQLQTLAQGKKKQPVDYVDNWIGVSDEISNCVIGPQLPFGSINPSPQTLQGEDDGYNPGQPIRGFGQLHVSGTGWGTNGQIFISAQTGLSVSEEGHDSPKSKESAFPYQYAVTLDRYHIDVKVSPSYHTAIYSFTFPRSDSSHLLMDITHNLPMDIKKNIGGEVAEGSIAFDTDDHQSFSGYGIYRGGFGGGKYPVYFCAKLSKRPSGYGTWINGQLTAGSSRQSLLKKNDRVGAYMRFKTEADDRIYLKVAVSYKSVDQARFWMEQEMPGWDYETYKRSAKAAWNQTLGKIEVQEGDQKDLTIFYTALYHAHLMPRNRTDDNQAFGKNVPFWDDHFAVWDTWRTLYPLYELTDQNVVSGTINSFIARHKKYGAVRDAFVNGNDMLSEQGGNNIDNIIADGFVKHAPGVNWEAAYEVMKYDADQQRLGSFAWRPQDSLSNTYKTKGWIPAGIMNCSMSLEYNYNDFCTASVARGLGKTADYKLYLNRSKNWINLWNKDQESDGFKGFIAPKTLQGEFISIDAKAYPGSWKNYFYEASSWNYSWFMPHQFKELVELNGGKELFAKKLNYGFENKLIHYDNEPAFLAVHGFIYAGRPDLTSYWVRQLMRKSFTDKGYPGNDDSGAMSSWYAFSAMGFFPNAGQPIYYLTGPLFKQVKIHMSNGNTLTLLAPNASVKNIYVKSITVNGKKWESPVIGHEIISQGATILFDMTDQAPVNQ